MSVPAKAKVDPEELASQDLLDFDDQSRLNEIRLAYKEFYALSKSLFDAEKSQFLSLGFLGSVTLVVGLCLSTIFVALSAVLLIWLYGFPSNLEENIQIPALDDILYAFTNDSCDRIPFRTKKYEPTCPVPSRKSTQWYNAMNLLLIAGVWFSLISICFSICICMDIFRIQNKFRTIVVQAFVGNFMLSLISSYLMLSLPTREVFNVVLSILSILRLSKESSTCLRQEDNKYVYGKPGSFYLVEMISNPLAWLYIIIRRSALGLSDFATAISISLSVIENPVAPEHVRIRWICSCGHESFDDFYDPKGERSAEIMRHLVSYGDISETVLDQDVGNRFRRWFIHLSTRIKNLLRSIFVANKVTKINQALPMSLDQASTEMEKRKNECTSKYLLLCIRDKSASLELHHLDVVDIKSDKELFRTLATEYKRVSKANVFHFRNLVGIRFVEFDIWRSQSINRIIRYDELPPRKEWAKYEFEPRVWSLPPPPISSSRLMHLLKCPANESYVSNCPTQFPKKLATRLEWSNNPIERVGWGLEFIEDFHWGTGLTAFIIILFLVGLLFGVLYGYFKHDFQTSLSISGYIAIFISIVTASWQARVMTEMRIAR